MQHCPICRALLNGVETCRRCRAELKQVQEMERQGRVLAGEAMRLLALGDAAQSERLLRRARIVHATPEVRLLSKIVAVAGAAGEAQPAPDQATSTWDPPDLSTPATSS
jgi:hypothetical protein